MQFMDSTVLFFLLLWISPAVQAPAGILTLITSTPPTVSNIDAAAAPAPVSEASNSSACSPAVAALAQGIKDNIAVQNNEVAAVTTLGAMLNENPVDPTLFAAGQASLLGFVKQGIAIRQNNQQIAPAGNAALPGLAMVAMAQMTELNLTMGLGMGGVSLARDNATVGMLLGDFKGGIEQNGKNLQAAMGNCTMAASSNGTSSGSGTGSGSAAGTGTVPKSTASARPAKMAERKMRI